MTTCTATEHDHMYSDRDGGRAVQMTLHPLVEHPEIYYDRLGALDYPAIQNRMRAEARRVLAHYGAGEAWRRADTDDLIEQMTSMILWAFATAFEQRSADAFRRALADAEARRTEQNGGGRG